MIANHNWGYPCFLIQFFPKMRQMNYFPKKNAWILIAAGLIPVDNSPTACAQTTVELAGSKFKNVTALTEMPADQMGKVMNIMSASLGVDCQFCHDKTDFSKEDVAHKSVGRQMIEMTLELNKRSFRGRSEVTCYTCHRGQPVPLALVPFEPISIAQDADQPTTIPSVDEIILKYIDALGGQAKLNSIKTRHTIARRIEPDGSSEAEELWQTAGGIHNVVTIYGNVSIREAFDGQVASKTVNADPIPLKADEALQIEREAQLAFGQNFKLALANLTYQRTEQIAGRRVLVLSAVNSIKAKERFYFDESSGFLVRRTTSVPTVLGDFVYQVDYQQYQSFDGVQVPTKLHFIVPNITWTREIISVSHNQPQPSTPNQSDRR